MLVKSRIGAILIALFICACDSSEENITEREVVRPVKLIAVNEAGANHVNRFPAVVGANRLSELSLQVGGRLKEFPLKDAQEVKRGDLIAVLDARDFESAVASAKAQFDNANTEYQRGLRLAKEDAIARNVLEQRKAQLEVSKAQLNQAEKALADSVLRAPHGGIVAETLVKNLETVSAGQAIVKLMSQDVFKATIDLPASFIARIPKEESEDENRQAFVFLNVAPNQPIEAQYSEAVLIADTASQTYAITFTFLPPANLNVLPGMNATVELRRNMETAGKRFSAPLGAVSSDGEKHYVWVVDSETMIVTKRSVTVESGIGSAVVITDGLSSNEMIVGAGADYLSEGMKVRAWK